MLLLDSLAAVIQTMKLAVQFPYHLVVFAIVMLSAMNLVTAVKIYWIYGAFLVSLQ